MFAIQVTSLSILFIQLLVVSVSSVHEDSLNFATLPSFQAIGGRIGFVDGPVPETLDMKRACMARF